MSGHRNFKELVAKMSPERRARVKAEADERAHMVGVRQCEVHFRQEFLGVF